MITKYVMRQCFLLASENKSDAEFKLQLFKAETCISFLGMLSGLFPFVLFPVWCFLSSANCRMEPVVTNSSPIVEGDGKEETKDLAGQAHAPETSASFSEILHLVQTGQNIPGLQKLNITPTHKSPAPSQMARRPKPWENTSWRTEIPLALHLSQEQGILTKTHWTDGWLCLRYIILTTY